MGNSSQGSSNSSTNNQVQVPNWLKPYYKGTATDLISAMKSLPNLQQLYSGTPLQGTAALTGGTNQDISALQQIAGAGNNAATQAGQEGLGNFVGGGANQPSAATQAEIQNFNTLQAPLLESQAALSGLGNLGALLSSLAQGQESALVPFLQQDTQNQLTAAQGLGSLGQQEAQTQQGQYGSALSASQLPQQNTQEALNNLYNQAQQQWQLASGIQTGGQAQFPALFGGNSQSTSNTSAPKF